MFDLDALHSELKLVVKTLHKFILVQVPDLTMDCFLSDEILYNAIECTRAVFRSKLEYLLLSDKVSLQDGIDIYTDCVHYHDLFLDTSLQDLRNLSDVLEVYEIDAYVFTFRKFVHAYGLTVSSYLISNRIINPSTNIEKFSQKLVANLLSLVNT